MKATLAVLAAFGAGYACGDREAIVERLSDKYGESQVTVEIINEESAGEVWASAETGTWSILVTSVTGVSCIVAVGAGWIDYPEAQVVGEPI